MPVTRLRDAQRQLTRERLLDAAAMLFANTGYANTRIEDITRHAGSSRATFYLHFGSKPAIADELFSRALIGACEYVQDAMNALCARNIQTVRRTLMRLFADLEAHRDTLATLQEAFVVERSTLAPAWTTQIEKSARMLAQQLERQAAIDTDLARAALFVLAGLIDGLALWGHAPRFVPLSREQAIDTLTVLWCTAVNTQVDGTTHPQPPRVPEIDPWSFLAAAPPTS